MNKMKAQFLMLKDAELIALTDLIRAKKPIMTGLNIERHPFRIKALELEKNSVILAQLQKLSDLDSVLDDVTFNFNLNDNKYFFQGLIKATDPDSLNIRVELTTDIHWVHRRAQERLIIPPTFHGAFRINYINSKLTKSFSRILNISETGCGLEFKTDVVLNAQDKVQGELSFISRPHSIDVECEVVHRRECRDDEGRLVYLFGLRYLFKKPQEEEDIKELMIDLFRDIFVSSKKVS